MASHALNHTDRKIHGTSQTDESSSTLGDLFHSMFEKMTVLPPQVICSIVWLRKEPYSYGTRPRYVSNMETDNNADSSFLVFSVFPV
jgi:hypothetical protein